MKRVIDKKTYDTQTAYRLTRSDFGIELYVTPKGRYFAAHWDHFNRGRDYIEALTVDDAIKLYELHDGAQSAARAYVTFETAFPDVAVEEA